MKITHIEIIRGFDDGILGHATSALVRVGTDSGIEGCAFSRNDPRAFLDSAKNALIGKDPHAIEEHIRKPPPLETGARKKEKKRKKKSFRRHYHPW